MGSLKKHKILPGTLKLTIIRLEEGDNVPNCVDPMMRPLSPSSGRAGVVRIIQDFTSDPKAGMELMNCCYVYPQNLDFESVILFKNFRNLVLKFEVFDSDSSTAVPLSVGLFFFFFLCNAFPVRARQLIYGTMQGRALVKHVFSTVTYHNRFPSYHDVSIFSDFWVSSRNLLCVQEIKVCLPLALAPRLHIKVTIYHVHIKSSKRHDADPLELIGFSVLPLVTNQHCLIEDGAYSLPVALELPDQYLRYCPLGQLTNQASSPIAWLGDGRPLFSLTFRAYTTLHVQNSTLLTVFQSDGSIKSRSLVRKEGPLDAAPNLEHLYGLQYVPKNQLSRFLLVLLKKLLSIISCSDHETLPQGATTAFLNVLNIVNESGGRSKCLDNFVKYGFSNFSGENSYLFERLITIWRDFLSSGSQEAENLTLRHSWFLFELIEKSAILYLEEKNLFTGPRKGRFTNHVTANFEALISLFSKKVYHVVMSDSHYLLGQSLNRNLAFFLRNCLSYMDRTVVFDLIQQHVAILSADQHPSLLENKTSFMHVVLMYEHYLPMCLPLPTTIKTSELTVTNPLFLERHGLLSLLMSELPKHLSEHVLDRPKRSRPFLMFLQVIKALFRKVFFDERHANMKLKHRIACLHFPLVPFVLDNSAKLLHTSSAGAPDVGSTLKFASTETLPCLSDLLDLKESRDLCLLFLSLLCYLEKDFIVAWLQEESVIRKEALASVLEACVYHFNYSGKDAVVFSLLKKEGSDKKKVSAELAKVTLSETYEKILPGKKRIAAMRQLRQERSESDALYRLGAPSLISDYESDARMSTPPESVSDEKAEKAILVSQAISQEVSLMVLELYDVFLSLKCPRETPELREKYCRVLLSVLKNNQTEPILLKTFSALLVFINDKPDLLFSGSVDLCFSLCREFVRYCSSRISSIRNKAVVCIYALMRANYEYTRSNITRTSVQLAMAVSRVLASFNKESAESIRQSPCPSRDGVNFFLTNVRLLCQWDTAIKAAFKEKFNLVIDNMTRIYRDTIRMLENSDDPYLYSDMQYRIAEGYRNSPDLRLTWLQNIEAFHQNEQNFAEVAMCRVHMCALISEYLFTTNYSQGLPSGASAFYSVSPNVNDESAVHSSFENEEGLSCSSEFSEQGFSVLLESCRSALQKADLYELVLKIGKIHIALLEKDRMYEWMKVVYLAMADTTDSVISANKDKRLLGTYFRVRFRGPAFTEMSEKEFIYKEPKVVCLLNLSSLFMKVECPYR
jgi:hypothetical protein